MISGILTCFPCMCQQNTTFDIWLRQKQRKLVYPLYWFLDKIQGKARVLALVGLWEGIWNVWNEFRQSSLSVKQKAWQYQIIQNIQSTVPICFELDCDDISYYVWFILYRVHPSQKLSSISQSPLRQKTRRDSDVSTLSPKQGPVKADHAIPMSPPASSPRQQKRWASNTGKTWTFIYSIIQTSTLDNDCHCKCYN